MKKIFILLLSLLSALLLVSCTKSQPDQYELLEKNKIIYKTAGNIQIELDIFFPTVRVHEKNPTVILLHGGGWISGSKNDFYDDFAPLCNKLRENGVAVVGVEYRLAAGGRTWRDCLEDCRDALAFLIEHADEYDIDTDNIGFIGYSAGAHLALMTAIETEGQVKYCVSLSGPTTFTIQRDSSYYSYALDYYIGLAFGENIEKEFIDASPAIRLNRDCTSSFLLINGLEDNVIPASHAERFCREAESIGLDVELIIPDKLTHSYPSFSDFLKLCDTIAVKISEKLSE